MKRAIVFALAASILALSGSTCQPPPPREKRDPALRTFTSAEELRAYFANQALARAGTNGSTGRLPFLFLPLAPAAGLEDTNTGAPGSDQGGAGNGRDVGYSTTNVQEPGVDEGDVIKNDGQYLYLLKANSLRIVKADPPDAMQQVAQLALPPTADSLYLRDNQLVALSNAYGYYGDIHILPLGADMMSPSDPDAVNQTTVTLVDITDRASPTVTATLKFDGNIVSSRLVRNKLHLVLATMPPLPDNPTPAAIESRSAEEWIPDYQMVKSGSTTGGDVAPWDAFYYPANPNGYGITVVVTVDVDNPDAEFRSTAIVADAGTIYASPSALYVTDTEYDINGYWREDTAVHKFDLTGDAATYVASGLVPGHLLNQYSLGEKDGYLRVATTVQAPMVGPFWVDDIGFIGGGSVAPAGGGVAAAAEGDATTADDDEPATVGQTPGNAVYVLKEGDTAGRLDIVGRIEGIKPDETLYAARFVGDRGFLVTFRQIDPLFTLDLSDPTDPKLVGELEVPGFSEYIHLMDDNHLLTIGKDATETGIPGGVQLSIFDVTDLANPTLVDKRIIGSAGTWSEAETNPKAFNYFAEQDALAIPINIYQYVDGAPSAMRTEPTDGFAGIIVYRVTVQNGFELLGRISTRTENDPYDYCFYCDSATYKRGVFIGDDVYAVSDQVVKAAPIATPESLLGTLELPD